MYMHKTPADINSLRVGHRTLVRASVARVERRQRGSGKAIHAARINGPPPWFAV